MIQYLNLLKEIKETGTYKPAARENMPGTQSLFGHQFRHNLASGFPLLTTKKMYWKGIYVELLWFLKGDTNVKYLIDNGVNIWNGDAYGYYLKKFNSQMKLQYNDGASPTPLSEESFVELIKSGTTDEKNNAITHNGIIIPNYILGDCGYQYGRVWRNWNGITFNENERQIKDSVHIKVDQIDTLIKNLKKNPESRRHLVTAIDPLHDTDLALYWCHAMFQFNCRPLTFEEKLQWVMKNTDVELENLAITERAYKDDVPKYYLDCQLYQRSADVILGVPFNIASYALLTEIIAKICNMIPGEFIHSFGDVHIYDNHREAVEVQIQRIPTKLPKLILADYINTEYEFGLDRLFNKMRDLSTKPFTLIDYNPQEKIDAELSTGLAK